jgi:hypothetical protein
MEAQSCAVYDGIWEKPVLPGRIYLMKRKNAAPALGRAYCDCGQSVI